MTWGSLGTRVLSHPQISFFDKTGAIVGPLLLMMLNDGMNGKFRTCGELLSEWDGGTWGTEGIVEHSGILVGHLRWLANFGKQSTPGWM